MLGAGLSVGALARRGLPGAAGPAPVDHYLTSGTMPAWASVARSTSGSRVRADTRLIEVLAPNTARLTASPVTGAWLGLLLEPDGLYYGPAAEDVGGSGWQLAGGLTRADIGADSPLRTTDAVSRLANGTVSYAAIQSVPAVQPAAGLTQCWLIRRGTTVTGGIVLRDGTLIAQRFASFLWTDNVLSALSLPASQSGLAMPKGGVVDYGGWYLAWCDCTYPAGDLITALRVDPAQSPVGGAIDVAAAWVVAGTHGYAPSYMPTDVAAVQRYADVLTIDWSLIPALPLVIEYTTLAGAAATPLVLQPGAQPTGLTGIVTRMRQ